MQCTYYTTNYTTQGIATEQQVLSICIWPFCTHSTTVIEHLWIFYWLALVLETYIVVNQSTVVIALNPILLQNVWQGDLFFKVLFQYALLLVVTWCCIAVAGDWPSPVVISLTTRCPCGHTIQAHAGKLMIPNILKCCGLKLMHALFPL